MGRRIALIISFCMLLLVPINSFGQSVSVPKNRVYYVDNSGSMKQKIMNTKTKKLEPLWNIVKENLVQSIKNVTNEDDRITVCFFSDVSLGIESKTVTANQRGKNDIIKFIEDQKEPVGDEYFTHHSIAFEDYFKNRIADGYTNLFFILTDGADEFYKKEEYKKSLENH